MAEIPYWLKGSQELNFGDYLSEYLLTHLFLETSRRRVDVRLIGSVLHNWYIPSETAGQAQTSARVWGTSPVAMQPERLVAWGCGIREPGGLSSDHRPLVEILSVRGPISAAELGLGPDVPQGDPAFLLPALYTPRHPEDWSGTTVCIPHFHDRRTDRELLAQSGCDRVLRPNIAYGEDHIERFIDAAVSARFVLSASLHGAVVAAAYRRPFAFWDPGVVDLPTKWRDLAASLGIPADFVADLPSGVAHYDAHLADRVNLPSLWTSLAASPYPLRVDAALKVLRYELSPMADTELENALAARIAVFERKGAHFAAIAAEGRHEMSASLQAIADRDRGLAATSRELELVREQNARLTTRLRAAESGVTESVSVRVPANSTAQPQATAASDFDLLLPLFDSMWYLHRNPDVRNAGVSPLAHYLQFGASEGRDPHPLFDAAWYLRQNPDVRDAGVNPFLHFVQFGAAEGRNPHPLFDAAWYRRQNPDVCDAGVNPLTHYVQFGAAEGRDPHPLFDTSWYLRQDPDLRNEGVNPLLHYLQVGAFRGRDPHPLFDGDFYRERYLRDVIQGTNPLLHYVTSGADCGLPPNRAFDAKGYAYQHDEVRERDGNGLIHYVTVGRHAGLQPHPLFEREWYAASNPDVLASGIDPYEHFVRYGLPQGRLGSPALGDDPRLTAQLQGTMPGRDATVAIIVESHQNYFDTYRCLVSIARMTGTQIPYLVAVADDDPEKRLTRLLEEGLNVVFPRPGGVEDHETPFLVFFDSAAVATKGWLTPMVDLASRNSRAAVIDCKHVASDGSLWGAGGAMSSSGLSRAYGRGDDPDKPEYSYVREVDCVLGGCFLTTRTAIAAVGGFDNGFATGRYRDLDFAFAVRQTGRSVLYQPESTVRIFSPTPENGAREPDAPADRERFCKRWAEALGSQPDHELNAVV